MKHRNHTLWIALLSVAALGAACESNPYPKSGQVVVEKPKPPTKELPPLGIDVPDVMTFVEGQEGVYTIRGWVPAGDAKLEISGLPTGATYDLATETLRWTPDFSAANDPKAPGKPSRDYAIALRVSSSLDPKTVKDRSALIVVNDSPRPATVKATGTGRVREGDTYTETVTIESLDFPQGPFSLVGKNLPTTASIEKTSDSTFTIRFSPGFHEVRGAPGNVTVYKVEYTVFGPNGSSTTLPVRDWYVQDSRQAPRVLGPTEVRQGASAGFTVLVEDPNGEHDPVLRLPESVPFGNLELIREDLVNPAPGENPKRSFYISWTEVPETEFAKDHTLRLRACVGPFQTCVDRSVKVRFEAGTRPAPTIQRGAWPLGSLKYVREGTATTVSLPVVAGSAADSIAKVEVLPAGDVRWENGSLVLQPRRAGLMQINVRAVSKFGAVSSESFLFEALPASWSSILVFGDSQKDPEVAFAQRVFPGAAVLNPAIQDIDARALALRETMMIGTSVLRSTLASTVERIVAATPARILLSSPALDALNGAIGGELRSRGLILAGRPFEVAPAVMVAGEDPFSLRSLVEPAQGSALPASKEPVALLGSTTAESKRPMTFAFGVRSRCEPSLVARHAGGMFAVGAVCGTQANKERKIIVIGFEWADLEFQLADSGLAQAWIDAMVKQ